MKLALIYTTFPKASETFLQREASALIEKGQDVEFFSIVGGSNIFQGRKVICLGWIGLILSFFKLLITPRVWPVLVPPRAVSAMGYIENLAGLLAGLEWQGRLQKFDWIHAQWGGAPAMAAIIAQVGFSTGLHAYDLYEDGGDAWMELKVARASGVTCSNDQALQEVRRRFPGKASVLVRRSLRSKELVTLGAWRRGEKISFATVGRLVEKKGLENFIALLMELKERELNFRAEIIGDGPMRRALERLISENNLNDCVTMPGWLGIDEVLQRLRTTDFMVFSGKVAKNGDRDGFPNVIAEAFAAGAVVLARDVAGVREGVIPGKTGVLMGSDEPGAWADALEVLLSNPSQAEILRQGGYAWLKENFDAQKNAQKFVETLARFSEGDSLRD